MITQVICKDRKWSEDDLFDGWGGETPPRWIGPLAGLVVERFHKELEKVGIKADWYPKTSEVVAHPDDFNELTLNNAADLNGIRDRVMVQVWEEFVDGDLDAFLDDQEQR